MSEQGEGYKPQHTIVEHRSDFSLTLLVTIFCLFCAIVIAILYLG